MPDTLRKASVLTRVWFALSLALLWLLTHPYSGIRHDAQLYTAQALFNLDPGAFARDLFFAYGSQDSWTIFGKLEARLFAAFGMHATYLVLLGLFQLLWLGGAWQLCRRLLPAPWHRLAMLLAVAMPAYYGGYFVFAYGEPFFSARLPAEALSLWALAWTLPPRGRWRVSASIALILLACAIHPLIGSVGLALMIMQATPRVRWVPVFGVAGIVFAIAQFLPWPWLHLQPLDPAWLALLRDNLPHVFPTRWFWMDWSKACWVIALPLILAVTAPHAQRRLWANLGLIGLSGFGATWLADLGGHDAVWLQLQPWRVLWLLTLLQWPAALTLVIQQARQRPVLLWVLFDCWLMIDGWGGELALGLAAVLLLRSLRPGWDKLELLQAFTPLIATALAVTTLLAAVVGWIDLHGLHQALTLYRQTATRPFELSWMETLVHTWLMLPLALLLFALAQRSVQRWSSTLLLLLSVPLGSYALINVDQRVDSLKIVEARLDQPAAAPFAGTVAPGSLVYWDGTSDELVYPWFLMRTGSYFSPIQAAGMVFKRQTSFEAQRRARVIWPDATDPDFTKLSSWRQFRPLSAEGLLRVCHDPVVDFVVSHQLDPQLEPVQSWSPTPALQVWLYDCRRLRRGTGISP